MKKVGYQTNGSETIYRFAQITLIIGIMIFTYREKLFTQNKDNGIIIGYSKNLFVGFNINDAKVAASLMGDALMKEGSRKASNVSIVINNMDEVAELVKSDKLDYVSMTSIEYISIKDRTKIYPYCVPVTRDNILNRVLLLVREDSNIKSINDMKNKVISSSSYLDEEFKVQTLWLKTLFWNNKVKNINRFISNIRIHENPQVIVYDVFFKNSDACVVFESEYETLKELNPQIGKTLKVFAYSDPLLTQLGCYTENSKRDPDLDYNIKTTYELSKSTNGKNLLKLLKIKQLLPYKEEYLDKTEKLYQEYIFLKQKKS
jgi:ABC-type phosphate/phosphonate transport system substrate-binding protein